MFRLISQTIYHDGKPFRLEVVQPHGSGGNYDVYIDNYYRGCIVLMYNGWYAHINSKVLTGGDLGVIMDRIAEIQ